MQTNPVNDPYEDEPEFELEDNLVMMDGTDTESSQDSETQELSSVSNSPAQPPEQQFATAIHYARSEDYYLAAKWFRKAAMQGHTKAQFYLAMLFVKGQGVPRSVFHAYSWLSLACCLPLPEAVSARKQLEPHLTARQIQSALKVAADRFEQIEDLSQH